MPLVTSKEMFKKAYAKDDYRWRGQHYRAVQH